MLDIEQTRAARPSRRKLRLYRAVLRILPTVLASWMKRLLRVRRRVAATKYGTFWVDPVSNLGLTLLEHGQYEPEMAAVLEALLTPGGTFVDLGANEGYFSVLGARLVGDRGRVVAIEPQGRLAPVIERNLTLNRVTTVALVRAAVTDRPGSAVLFIAPDTNTGATGLERATRYQVGTETVPTLTLVQVFDQTGLDAVDLLKVDIEGFEYEAILGSAELFRERHVRAVALELHPTILARRDSTRSGCSPCSAMRGTSWTPASAAACCVRRGSDAARWVGDKSLLGRTMRPPRCGLPTRAWQPEDGYRSGYAIP